MVNSVTTTRAFSYGIGPSFFLSSQMPAQRIRSTVSANAAGAPNVAWGAWQPFIDYVAKLNWFAPPASIPILAWTSTVAEVILAVGLLVGWQLRWFALAAGLLLLSFAITMTLALGVKAPLDFSVFAAAGGAFLLAASSGKA